MSSLIYRAILISCSTGLSACATQTYPGPELSNDQIATVSLVVTIHILVATVLDIPA
ncbi:hypothetical protein ACH50O_13415 [Methylomonas sp. 2BW1-5-20]|uniref:hypothetical protein n=1 Tax=Methylomonas sp. 2BW1-5-20 TaxID=3376686 RepID=UPI004050F31F